jgi:hypothetical protein
VAIRVQVVAWCTDAGIPLADPTKLEPVLFAYFSVKRRLIEPHPRGVKWSRELSARTVTDSQGEALSLIERQAREGVNLTPRLSKSILDPEFNDGLLEDWGIHHMHLSNKVQANGFVERDGPLLFVMVHPETMFLVDLRDHDSFADDELLQIVHDNWPDAIADFRAPGAVPGSLSPQLSPTSRRKARKRLTVGWQAADGTIYLPPGGGTTTSGLSPEVVDAADDLRRKAHNAEEWVRKSAERIRDAIAERTGARVEELRMKFVLRDPLSILETQTNAVIPLRFDPATVPLLHDD